MAKPEQQETPDFDAMTYAELNAYWEAVSSDLLLEDIEEFRRLKTIVDKKYEQEFGHNWHETSTVIAGGGPSAWSIAALCALNDEPFVLVSPESYGDELPEGIRPSYARGQFRQSASIGKDAEATQRIQELYDAFDIEYFPVESVQLYESPEDFERDYEALENREDIRIIDLEQSDERFPFTADSLKAAGLCTTIIVQQKMEKGNYGACNIDMSSFMRAMKKFATASSKSKIIEGKRVTGIERQTNRIMVETEGKNSDILFAENTVMISAGLETHGILKKNEENLRSSLVEPLAEAADGVGAPTITYDLPEGHALHSRPMNISVIRNGGHYLFGIYEKGEYRFSLFDLERFGEAAEKLSEPDRKLYESVQRVIQKGKSWYAANKHTATKEKLKQQAVEPYVISHTGFPIIGEITNDKRGFELKGQMRRSDGSKPEVHVSYADNGGGASMFLPKLFNTFTGVAVQKMLKIKSAGRNREVGVFEALLESSDPAAHVAASLARKRDGGGRPR